MDDVQGSTVYIRRSSWQKEILLALLILSTFAVACHAHDETELNTHPSLRTAAPEIYLTASAEPDASAANGDPENESQKPKKSMRNFLTAIKNLVTLFEIDVNMSVKRMAKKADYETYIFATNPPWTDSRTITGFRHPDKGTRMFAISYHAKDRRHVALLQGFFDKRSLDKKFGLDVETQQPVYESPAGVKVRDTSKDREWSATFLQGSIGKDSPAENRTSYILETPAATFPVLAVNGRLTDQELHALIDELIPAKEYKGK